MWELLMCGGDIHMWENSHVKGTFTCGIYMWRDIHVWELLMCGGDFHMCELLMCGGDIHLWELLVWNEPPK